MGKDKATILIDGETLLDRQIRIGQGIFPEVWISGRSYGPRSFLDEWPGLGPLGGILTSFQAVPHAQWYLIYPVDIPFLTGAELKRIRDAAITNDIHQAIYFEGSEMPLTLRNHNNVRTNVEDLLRKVNPSMRSVRNLLSKLNSLVLSAPKGRDLHNVNTPLDLEALNEHQAF